MIEILFFLCCLPVIVITFVFVIIYVNIRRQLNGLKPVSGISALREFWGELFSSDGRTQSKGKSPESAGSENNSNVEDAEFRELE